MFNYRILESVYDDMIIGKKTMEFRLWNEKSQKMQIGDKIKFSVLDSNKYVIAEILGNVLYDDIDDLWNHKEVLDSVLDYSKEEFKEVFYSIFGKEKVLNSKIVGIKIKVLEHN